MTILEINGLAKSFGKVEVLKDVSFKVEKGRALGFIGKNEYGKTTTLKIVLGLMNKDSGSIKIEDKLIDSYLDYKGMRIGFLPDVPDFYSYMKPKEYLKLCGEILGLSREEISEETNYLLNLFELEKEDRKIAGFSRGMKQRLGMASALLGKPDILFCDEPTSALDPIGRHEILELMKKIKKETTIVFSTHILKDVEEVCDEVTILNEGKIIYSGSIDNLKGRYDNNSLKVIFYKEKDLLYIKGKLENLNIASNIVEGNILIIDVVEEENFWNLIYDSRIKLKEYSRRKIALEDIFMEMTK